MRLHPAVSHEEAYAWLKKQVEEEGRVDVPEVDVETTLHSFAEAMAAISRVVLPDELEPMFP